MTRIERKQRQTIWNNEDLVGFHSIYHDELVLSAENCGRFPNGNWVRFLELDINGTDHVEFGRVFWHLDSTLDDLEKAMRAMADCRFPVSSDEPVDPEEP